MSIAGYDMAAATGLSGQVFVLSPGPAPVVAALRATFRAMGARSLLVTADGLPGESDGEMCVSPSAGEWDNPEALSRALLAPFGRVDVLVNLALLPPAGPLTAQAAALREPEGSQPGLAFRLSRAIAPALQRAGSGSLIHLVPEGCLLSRPQEALAAVQGLAVAGLSRAIALDYAGTGLRSNLVALSEEPGAAATAAALAVLLAGPGGAGISGQVLLAGAREVHLLSQPRPIRTLHRDGGWDLPSLAEVLPRRWASALVPLAEDAPVAPLPPPGPSNLAGKVAIVTGAGRGIGRAIALRLAAEGARVVVNDLGVSVSGEAEAADPADEVAGEIVAAGGEALADKGSVTDPEAVRSMVDAALHRFGRLDIVVNNAGILRPARFEAMALAEWEAVLAVHLRGSLMLSRAAAPHLARQGGAYVHMTSASGLIGSTMQANYAAAKLGIVGLSRALALELGGQGVRSNCVAPSSTSRMTALTDSRRQAELTAEAAEILRRARAASQPEHMAPLVAFLAGDAAAGITGQVIGARGNELYLYGGFRPLRSLHSREPWTPASLAACLPQAWGPSLVPLDRITDVFAWVPF